MMSDDMALVREYARSGSEQAFATLVSRHVNLVYSVALRQVGDPHVAEEVVQGVFIVFSKKAKTLGPKTIVSAWLCRTARFVSAHALRSQRRRQLHEREAHMQSMMNGPDLDTWAEIAPILDEAVASLNRREHDALVLRFFDGMAFAEMGAALGTTEDSARVRVNRAVEKLRRFFSKRGVAVSATILTGLVAANSVQAAPAGLATTATTTAVKGMSVSGAIASWAQSTMKTLLWLKVRLAAGIVAALLGVGGVIVVGTQARFGFRFTQQPGMLIVPGVSVGKVVRGMATNEVEAVLGKPDRWAGKMMVYDKRYGMSVAQSERGAVAVLCGDPVKNADGKKFIGRTKEGIGMVSSCDDVKAVFGQPSSWQASPDGGASWEQLEYPNLGLSFSLVDRKVIYIVVKLSDADGKGGKDTSVH